MEDESKKINITGTSNRYQIKKLTTKSYDKESKKRVESEKWTFSEEHYKYENQIKMIQDISNNNFNHVDEVSKIAIQQINRKIYGYKQQDIIKKLLNEKELLVDRIDNDQGHNINNFHLACLDCNLKRRRRTDEKFLFTKQLNIIKQDN